MSDWQETLKSLLGDQIPEDSASVQEPAAEPVAAVEKSRLDIILERKGRGGKVATIIAGFTVDDDTVSDIASKLKKTLGTGGSARGGEILIQGDRRNDVARALSAMGIKNRII